MKLRDIMTRDVEVLRPEASVLEAAQKMRSLDVGSIPVCNGKKVLGIITDRDITIRVTADGRDPRSSKVTEFMTPDITFAFEDQDVKEAAKIMQEEQIRRLIIVDRNKDLVGFVSLGDLAVEGDNERLSGKTLEEISEPAKPER